MVKELTAKQAAAYLKARGLTEFFEMLKKVNPTRSTKSLLKSIYRIKVVKKA